MSSQTTPSISKIQLLHQTLDAYLKAFIAQNKAGSVVSQGMHVIGIGLRPVLDHLFFYAADAGKRAKEFTNLGYKRDAWASMPRSPQVYRRVGYPAILIETAKGNSDAANWLQSFGDKTIVRLGVLVEDIENAVFYLEKQGIPFSGSVRGTKGESLRTISTQPEILKGRPFTSVQLVERHGGAVKF